jgi:ATP-binding cassette subfamily B protein
VLNLVIGVLPLGFVIGTSVAIGRVAGAGKSAWGGVLLAVGLEVASLLLQSVLSPFQAAFAELISRRVDGACARRLMRATLAQAPIDLLEQPDVLDKMGDARRGPERPVLSGICLDIPAGSVLALVGENGAGKSTLVKLLCRLYQPTDPHRRPGPGRTRPGSLALPRCHLVPGLPPH